MVFFYRILAVFFLISSVYAAEKTLIIGVDGFTPPFVMQGGRGELSGFDISMMESLCKIMQRTCQFKPMKFEELLPAVASNQIDMAMSSITITLDRAKTVNFSLPYLLGSSRFLTNRTKESEQPFSLSLLNGKKIGLESGTIFEEQIKQMGIVNAEIKLYPVIDDALKDLKDEEIDYIIFDNPTALYWEANSSGSFIAVGPPYVYGFGLGIAMNLANKNLLKEVNKAILKYQITGEYQTNYNRYLMLY